MRVVNDSGSAETVISMNDCCCSIVIIRVDKFDC